MTLVTLVSEKNASEGYEFIYTGPTPECKSCKIKNVCMSLEAGQRYRVTGIRDVVHECKQHDSVIVVEVEKMPLETAVEPRHASENTIITIDRRTCRHIGCENHSRCVPPYFSPGRYRVIEVGEGLKCHMDLELKAVTVEKA